MIVILAGPDIAAARRAPGGGNPGVLACAVRV
jgi:hypothetical protein